MCLILGVGGGIEYFDDSISTDDDTQVLVMLGTDQGFEVIKNMVIAIDYSDYFCCWWYLSISISTI